MKQYLFIENNKLILKKMSFLDIIPFYFFNKKLVNSLKHKSDYIFPSFFEIFNYYIKKNNYCFLLKKDKQIIAYISLVDNKHHNFKYWSRDFLFTYNEFKKSIKLDGVGVIKQYRHHDLMKFLIKFILKFLKNKKYNYIIAHVSPKNKESYNNLKKYGFKKINQVTMNGYLRDCLLKSLKNQK